MTAPRQLADRYVVGEILGYGNMAQVHKGRDLRMGRDVAIKMLRPHLARDRGFQERFDSEVSNMAALNHHAIVAIYDSGVQAVRTGENIPFIIMEFLDGQSLKEVLATQGRVSPTRALEITADVCAALEFSHRHGILHRDIKPGNIMIGHDGTPKVVDFGIARLSCRDGTATTFYHGVGGTASYLAPEQARGEKVDARADIYSVGCVLFEILCGHPPFMGDSPVSVAYQQVMESPPLPSSINPHVTEMVDAIVLKSLSKDPANRYQSAQEMRADSLRALAGREVLAKAIRSNSDHNTEPVSPAQGNHDLRLFERIRKLRHGRNVSQIGRLPDRSSSSAVFLGTAQHIDASLDIPAVSNNLTDLAQRLSDPEWGGFGSDRIHAFLNPQRDVLAQVAEIADDVHDTMLVFYSGHGMVSPDGRLYLSLPATQLPRVAYTAMPYEDLRQVVIDCPARNKVIILDCCFSGRAVGTMSPGEELALGQLDVAGSYVLTATSANRQAHAPLGQRHTAFAGALIRLLEFGIANGDDLLTLDEIYRYLVKHLSSRNLPVPQQRGIDTTGGLALARNPRRQ